MNKEELRQYSAKLMADKEELQERIDKAIDYIENNYERYALWNEYGKKDLLFILKGDDK